MNKGIPRRRNGRAARRARRAAPAARLLAALLWLLAGCQPLSIPNPFASPTATRPAPTSTPESAPAPPAGATSTAAGLPGAPLTLRIWLPPQFDPASGSEAGRLLQARLSEFVKRRPGVRLEVRLKALEGPGGMLEALSTASAAAPLALPDLVALPRSIMEAAALKGLLHPFDGLTETLDERDWPPFTRELARLQNSTYGLPFAADALILVYRPAAVAEPPRDWQQVLATPWQIVFPAADPQALLTLAYYQAAGGELQNEQGRPALETPVLARVLSFYRDAVQANILSPALAQIETDDEAWTAFHDERSALAITWFSQYLRLREGETLTGTQAITMPTEGASLPLGAAPIPTPEGVRYTLGTGWVWALASHSHEQQALASELAEFLTQGDFLAEWTAAAGFLPTRANALAAWMEEADRSLANQVIASAHLPPPGDVLSSLAPLLREAVLGQIQGGGDPLVLAQEAVERLENP